jgi:NADPH:quinone reductase-like Zn-dependent oxidoreductase
MDAAVQIGYGAAPRFGRHPDPEPLPGNSIVRVSAAPIVPLDLLCAGGRSYFGPPPLPYVPGVQGVGVVAGSTHPPGTRVFFTTDAGMKPGDGSLAELCSVRDEDLVVIDTDLADTAVAALGLSAVAGWMALSWRANLQSGETVLVLGAGGAVGQATIGAAHALGAGRVVALCRSESSCLRAEEAGADRVVRMPTTTDLTGLIDHLRKACADTADVVIDPVFGDAAVAAMAVLATGGRLVNLGGAAGDTATFSSSTLRSKSASVLGYTNNSLQPEQRAAALRAVLGHAQSGRIIVQHTVLPLADCQAGWQLTVDGGTRVVLAP